MLAACTDQDATGNRDKGEQLFIINMPREGLESLHPIMNWYQAPGPFKQPGSGRFSQPLGAVEGKGQESGGAVPVECNGFSVYFLPGIKTFPA